MHSDKELISDLNDVITKVDEIESLFSELSGDKGLEGIRTQAESLIDIMNHTDLLIYGYYKYIAETKDLYVRGSISSQNMEGRIRVIDFAHLRIDMDELFEGFPSDEHIAGESHNLAMEYEEIRMEGIGVPEYA